MASFCRLPRFTINRFMQYLCNSERLVGGCIEPLSSSKVSDCFASPVDSEDTFLVHMWLERRQPRKEVLSASASSFTSLDDLFVVVPCADYEDFIIKPGSAMYAFISRNLFHLNDRTSREWSLFVVNVSDRVTVQHVKCV